MSPPPPVQTPGFLSGVFLFPCKVYGITGPHRGREAVKPTGNGLYRRPHRRKATISLTRKHRNENRQLAVSISNTEKGLLDFLLLTVGAGNITGKRTVRPRHTPGFTCTPCNRQALNLPTQISIPAHRQEQACGPHTLRLPPLTRRNGKSTAQQRQVRKRNQSRCPGHTTCWCPEPKQGHQELADQGNRQDTG